MSQPQLSGPVSSLLGEFPSLLLPAYFVVLSKDFQQGKEAETMKSKHPDLLVDSTSPMDLARRSSK